MDFGFLESKFQKSKFGFGISILKILSAPIFRQNRQLWIFGSKFAPKWILGSKLQKPKSGFGISILEILLCQFSDKLDNFQDNFDFLGPNLPKYFSSNIVEGVAESWVEAEMSWLEVDGAGWRLKWAGWSWVELGGAGWRWVHGLVILKNYYLKKKSKIKWIKWILITHENFRVFFFFFFTDRRSERRFFNLREA